MPRRLRVADGGYVYHVLNRAVARAALFEKDGDYAAFLRVLTEAAAWRPVRLLCYCIMPNHWHLVLWPRRGPFGVSALVDGHPCAALACPSPYERLGLAVPGSVQIIPNPARRSPAYGVPLCGEKRAASRHGGTGGGMALEQPAPAE